MTHRRIRNRLVCIAFGLAAVQWSAPPSHGETADPAQKARAREILDATGVKGGLVVHLGCGNGKLTAALRVNDSYLVHGLDADPANVENARAHVRALGLYGKMSIECLGGARLPYANNLVNLVVVSVDETQVSREELMRVLAPGGVALISEVRDQKSEISRGAERLRVPTAAAGEVNVDGRKWAKLVKRWPKEIDEWAHVLYDASNNAVGSDRVVGPPRHMQWVAGPKWARSHDHLASVSVVVSSGGRIFSIVDEGPISAVALPAKWFLVARDAFNGVLLWKRPVGPWEGHLRGFRSGPPEISETLVAVGDKVYVTLGYGKPVTALDAATGRTVKTYQGTDDTLEIAHYNDVLFLVTGKRAEEKLADDAAAWRRGVTPRAHGKRILAVRADTGELLWSRSDDDTTEVMPTTLAISGDRLFLQNPLAVVCLEAKSGKVLWRAPRPVSTKRRGWSTPTLVVYRDVVLSADRAVAGRTEDEDAEAKKVEWEPNSAGGNAPVGELIAFSAETGRRLWSCKCQECYNAPVDVLVADGLVWTGELVRAKQPGITVGRDPRTGEVKRERPPDKTFFTVGMGHHRCHRNRATERYLVLGRAGVEFVDVKSGKAVADHWVRGGCQYGVIPCNGLLYAPSHSCACYIEAKLNGFWALAAGRSEDRGAGSEEAERLRRGPAYGANTENRQPKTDSWPTYRHDAARSGSTETPVPADLKRAWQADLGGKLSSLVMAEGKVFVAQIDAHAVHALEADSGKRVWSCTAGGRVDSPPTTYEGLVLFGSADGWVYCLRASDGQLAWRFRAAPEERRVVAYGQLESAWPVHGSVLIHDGAAYFVAGRSSYLDGGLYLYRLDPKTGKVLSEKRIDHRDPETGQEPQQVVRGTHMSGALPDVLSSDGTSIYMRHMRFGPDGEVQERNVPHLFSSVGFLDDSWWHRTYWLFGTSMGSGYGGWPRTGNRVPAGRLLVCDGDSIYGYGRDLYAHYGGHVGLDAATIYHYGRRRAQPRWVNSHLFSASKEAAQARRGRKRRTACCIGVEKSKSLNPAGKPLSVAAWAKAEKPNGAIVARGAFTHGYALYVQRGKPSFSIRVKLKLHTVSAKQNIVGQWTHLVGVLTTDKKLQIYVNGKLSSTADASGFLVADPGELMEIGADDSKNVGEYKSPFPFTGAIDEARVYHRALSPSEVEQQYDQPGKASNDALALYFSFDKGDARDDSGSKNHGTLEGAKPTDGKLDMAMAFTGERKGDGPPEGKYLWSAKAPFVARAMVLAGKTLFLAGAGDITPPSQTDEPTTPIRPDTLAPFAAVQEGRDAILWAVSTDDGKKLTQCRLPSSPVFDGMIVAQGRLYLATARGKVLCLAGTR